MIKAIARAFQQLGDPAFQRVILFGILGSLAVFVALWVLTWWLAGLVAWTQLPVVGWAFDWFAGWDWIGAAAFVGVMLAVSFLLFPAVMTAMVGIFLDDIVGAVESKYYADRPAPREIPVAESAWMGVKFLLLMIGVNLLALPIYAVLFLLPPLNLVFYYTLNGYLLGREFYEMVAFRRYTARTTHMLRRAHRGRITLAGAIFLFAMTVPLLNLIAPVLAAAAMVHVFEGLPKRQTLPDEYPLKSA